LNKDVLKNLFHKTLHKIYTFLEAQQVGIGIKHLFHRHEMQNLLKDCQAGLNQATETFVVCSIFQSFLQELDQIPLDYCRTCNVPQYWRDEENS
jgi:hypothetical protein